MTAIIVIFTIAKGHLIDRPRQQALLSLSLISQVSTHGVTHQVAHLRVATPVIIQSDMSAENDRFVFIRYKISAFFTQMTEFMEPRIHESQAFHLRQKRLVEPALPPIVGPPSPFDSQHELLEDRRCDVDIRCSGLDRELGRVSTTFGYEVGDCLHPHIDLVRPF